MREVWVDMSWANQYMALYDRRYRNDNFVVWKFNIDDNKQFDETNVRLQTFSSREEAQLMCEICGGEFKEFQYQTIKYDSNFHMNMLSFKCSWPEIENHFAIELSPKLKESLIS